MKNLTVAMTCTTGETREVKYEDISSVKGGTNWLEFKTSKLGKVKINRDFVIYCVESEVEDESTS